MNEHADIVIIGGGVVGCSTAYHLAKMGGAGRIILLEKDFICSGSTGRCGAGIRQQWGTETNCTLAIRSMEMFEHLQEELDYPEDMEFKQGGYLMMAHTEHMLEQFRKNVALQRGLGVDVSLITPQEAREIVPMLNTDGMLGATFCQRDGHLNPFRVTDAYARAAKRLGVEFRIRTEVTGLVREGDRITAVDTKAGRISAGKVINCSGAWAGELCRKAGVETPFYAEKHQILVTEPIEPCVKPMVISLYHGLYCQQSPHGSFIMGIGHPNEPRGFEVKADWRFAGEMASKVTHLLPRLKDLHVVRQWAGLYDMTPDAQPVYGLVPPLTNFYVAAGFSGHGFMHGPITGVLMSEIISGRPTSVDVSMLDMGRFKRGELFIEPSVV